MTKWEEVSSGKFLFTASSIISTTARARLTLLIKATCHIRSAIEFSVHRNRERVRRQFYIRPFSYLFDRSFETRARRERESNFTPRQLRFPYVPTISPNKPSSFPTTFNKSTDVETRSLTIALNRPQNICPTGDRSSNSFQKANNRLRSSKQLFDIQRPSHDHE